MSVKLTDLNPRWCSAGPNGAYGRHGMGLSFDCPHCRTQRLAVFFANPIDGGAAADGSETKYLWHRSGETFETLTLGPSIDASNKIQTVIDGRIELVGHWHGFITNGEVS